MGTGHRHGTVETSRQLREGFPRGQLLLTWEERDIRTLQAYEEAIKQMGQVTGPGAALEQQSATESDCSRKRRQCCIAKCCPPCLRAWLGSQLHYWLVQSSGDLGPCTHMEDSQILNPGPGLAQTWLWHCGRNQWFSLSPMLRPALCCMP